MPTIKDLALPALVNGAAVLVYIFATVKVGLARRKYKIAPPQVSGHPDFERIVRVQQNTLEQIAAFIPALWLCSIFFNPMVGAALGGGWVIGRIVYVWGYYQAAEKRLPGFALTLFATIGLLWCGIFGAIRNVL